MRCAARWVCTTDRRIERRRRPLLRGAVRRIAKHSRTARLSGPRLELMAGKDNLRERLAEPPRLKAVQHDSSNRLLALVRLLCGLSEYRADREVAGTRVEIHYCTGTH